MHKLRSFLAFGYLSFLLSACTNTGGYFQNDGPPSSVWGERDFSNAPNAVPRVEPPHKLANRPYSINGVKYQPLTGDAPLVQTGIASWYGKQFHGKKTSTGETYDMFAMSAAHTTMELPSYAKVTNLENGKNVIIRVNDRGPFLHNRVIDLSYAAASKLGYAHKGTAKVKVERIRRIDLQSGRFVIPGNIQMIESSDQNAEKQADVIALESILNEVSIDHLASTNVESFAVESTSPDSIKTDQNSQTFELELKDELKDAIDLTNLANQGEMVSTKSEKNTPENNRFYEVSNWRVQAGIFSNKTNAISRMNKLKDNIKQPFEIIEDNGRYRVLFGQFKDRKTAADLANEIGNILNEKFIIFEQK